jgi:putative endonuclease
LGAQGEQLAAAHLAGLGWQVVTANWRPHGAGLRGEIDLVARDGEWLVLVEVRTRRSGARGAPPHLGPPEDSLTPRKQLQLAAMALAYVHEMCWAGPWRIDVIALELGRDDSVTRLAHYRDAVGG